MSSSSSDSKDLSFLFEGTPSPNIVKQTQASSTSSSLGTWIAGGIGLIGVGIISIAIPFLRPGLRKICLPYLPATDTQVENVLTVLKPFKGSPSRRKLIDLGSGDGRIVFAAAKEGFDATGVELNSVLVWYCRLKSRLLGLHNHTNFLHGDLLEVNYTDFHHIVIFGVDTLMPVLEKKLTEASLSGFGKPHQLHVIACRFPLPRTRPLRVIGTGVDTVWSYTFFT